MRIIFLGDIVAKPGRRVVAEHLPRLRERFRPDVVIANGENASGGLGTDPSTAAEIFAAGVDVITGGNHSWEKREFFPYLEATQNIIRPANFPQGAPGRGMTLFSLPQAALEAESGGAPRKIAVLNLIGRVFMPQLVDCPFHAVDRLLEKLQAEFGGAEFGGAVKHIFVDFHAEATSEKLAFLHHLAGRVSCIVGTHTHVQTADAQILHGTAAITDAGMCGPFDGIIGVAAEHVVKKFRSGLPGKFDVAKGRCQLNGIYVETDESTGQAIHVERIYEIV